MIFKASTLPYRSKFGETGLARDLLKALFMTVAIMLAAPLTIPILPFSPVPITLQVTLALFLSVVVGARVALIAISCFLIEGAMSLPVFAGCRGGLQVFFGPTGGYLLGYLVAGVILGAIKDLYQKFSVSQMFLLLVGGHVIVYLFGILQLTNWMGSFEKAFLIGVFPYIPGDLLKSALLIKGWEKWSKKSRLLSQF